MSNEQYIIQKSTLTGIADAVRDMRHEPADLHIALMMASRIS